MHLRSIVPALLICAAAGCGGGRTEPVAVVEEVDTGPTETEIAKTHAEMRKRATATVEGRTGHNRLSHSDGAYSRKLDIGIAEDVSIKDGLFDGAYSRTYPSGKKEVETTYANGVKDGAWKSWYENGEVFEEGTYKAGNRHGTWTSYYDNGQKMEQAEYHDGKLIKTYGAWLADGTVIIDENIPRNY